MRSSKIKVLIGFLSLAIVLFIFPSMNSFADTVASGTCGDTLKWTLDSNGKLSISGFGSMKDYNDEEVPWANYRDSIKSLALSSKITYIGRYAFARCPNLTSVTIPQNVTSIGRWAFAFDYGLTSVSIPNGVTKIGWDAFRQCNKLTSIVIPDSVTTIEDMVFYKCTSLTSVTLPKGLTKIDKQFFDGCINLESIIIPNSVTSIDECAFRGCTSLTSIIVPNSVTSIGKSAFDGCSALTHVVLSNKTNTLGEAAFKGCLKLNSISIPNSVTTINAEAFSGCSDLTNVIIPYSVTSIGNNAFYGCTRLMSIVIDQSAYSQEAFPGISLDKFRYYYNVVYTNDGQGTIAGKAKSFSGEIIDFTVTPKSNYIIDKVTISYDNSIILVSPDSIGKYSYSMPESATAVTIKATFKDCVTSGKCGDNISWAWDGNGTLYITGSGDMQDHKGTNDDQSPWYSFNKEISTIVFSGNITSIGKYAFWGCNITTIEIPESVKSINDCAFGGCDKLNKVTFVGNSTVSIGGSAFGYCPNLNSIILPDNGDVMLHSKCFEGSYKIKNIVIHRDAIGKNGLSGTGKTNPYYDITYTNDGHGTITGNTRVYGQNKYKFQILPDEDYALDKVVLTHKTTGSTESINPDNDGYCVLPRSSDDVTISATFKTGFKVIVNETINGSVTVSKTKAVVGSEVSVYAKPDKGYKLSVIKVNGEEISGTTFEMPDTVATVDVLFEKIDYKLTGYVTTVWDGYSDRPDGDILSSKIANIGDEITISVAKYTGYEIEFFRVFYLSDDSYKDFTGNTFIMPADNVQVHVKIKKILYSVTISEINEGTATVSKDTASYGDQITITPSIGYEVDTIIVNGTTVEGSKFTMPAEDVTLIVNLRKKLHKITVSSNIYHGTFSVSTTTAYYGDEIVITILPETGYACEALRVNGKSSSRKFNMPDEDVTITGSFIKANYQVKASDATHGTFQVRNAYKDSDYKSITSGEYLDQIYIKFSPNYGYEPDLVKINGETVNYQLYNHTDGYKFTSFKMPSTNVIVEVTFKKSEYSIDVSSANGGTVEVSKNKATVGEKILAVANPNIGYELNGQIKITGAVAVFYNEDGSVEFVIGTSDVKVVASFNRIKYSVDLKVSTGGRANISNDQYYYGTEVTINISPDSGYELDSINVNGKAISGNKFVMDACDTTIEVLFIKHDLTKVPAKAATCTEAGYKEYYKCNRCNKLFSDAEGKLEISTPEAIKALGHEWDDGTVTKDPTCEEEGVKTFHCTHDGCTATKTEAIKAIGHSWDEGEVTKEPTCEEEGVKTFHCTRTGCTETKTAPVKALGHKIVTVAEKAPTKTEPGNIKHYKCERCGKLFSDANGKTEITQAQTVIPAMSHDLTEVKAKAATCTEPGNTAYYICKDDDCKCGKAYSDAYGQHEINIEDTVKPALGHNPVEAAGKDPTCTEDGYEKYYKCSRCHKLFSDADGKNEIEKPVAISKLGHDMKHVEAEKPTHEDDGHREYYHCNRCGKNFADADGTKALTDAEIVVPHIGAAVLNEEITEGDFIYKVTNPSTDGTGTVTVIGVANKTAAVIIPATVELKLDTYKINRIGTKAFYGNKTITSLSIGSNVVIIDSYAFYGCSNLVKVSGGKALKSIGTKAFAYCSKLKSFSITSSVLNKIGSYAFQKDKKLKTVYIKYTTKLTKSGVKKSLKGSSVKTVKVKKSKVKKYKKYFKKKNCGRKVKVKK